jgi:hypothetical protein
MRDYKEEINLSGLTQKEWYRTIYLYSDHWRSLREAAFAAHGRKCHCCPAKNRLEVHHLRYKAIYDVEVGDLQVLCRNCHQKEHDPVLKQKTSPPVYWGDDLPQFAQGILDESLFMAPKGGAKGKRNWAIKRTISVIGSQGKLTEALHNRLLMLKTGKKSRQLRSKKEKRGDNLHDLYLAGRLQTREQQREAFLRVPRNLLNGLTSTYKKTPFSKMIWLFLHGKL